MTSLSVNNELLTYLSPNNDLRMSLSRNNEITKNTGLRRNCTSDEKGKERKGKERKGKLCLGKETYTCTYQPISGFPAFCEK